MSILSRYLLKQHALPFVFAVSASTGLMLINTIATKLEDVIGKGLPWRIIVEFFALSVAYIFAVTLSMGVLIAVLYTFNTMTSDREITALRAGGVSLGRLVRPVLMAGVVVAFLAFLFGDQVLPRTNHRLRSLMTDIYRTKPTFSLKEHVINEIQKGRYALRTARIDQATYRLHDVTVYDLADQNHKRVVYADSGFMAFAPNQEDLQLTLFDGEVHQYDRTDPRLFQHTNYVRQAIVMRGVGREFVRRDQDDYRGDREMGICDLEGVVLKAREQAWLAESRATTERTNGLRSLVGLPALQSDTTPPSLAPSVYCRMLTQLAGWFGTAELRAQEQHKDSVTRVLVGEVSRPSRDAMLSRTASRRISEINVYQDRARAARGRESVYLVELHKKYAIPAACIVFVLAAIPIAIRFPHGGVGLCIGASMAVFLIYYVFLIAGESLANRLIVAPALVMWAPNMIFGLLGTGALWWVSREGTARGRRFRR